MQDPRTISIQDYSYSLPEDRIARYPLAERDASKLLIYGQNIIKEDTYRNIANHLTADSLLIFNDTKVIEARLLFTKPTGGVIEIFCLEPHERYPDVTTAMLQQEKVYWHCLVGGASKWKPGQVLEKNIKQASNEIKLYARYVEKRSGSFIIELSWTPGILSFAEILHHTGAIPLPPYIKRAVEESDKERYQTIYAHFEGSVAAPTAGLHFTERVFDSLKEKGIETDFVTLHVGAGTFKPVKSELMADHEMHAEWIDVPIATIRNIIRALDQNIIAVGTTSLRTIESLYWYGVKCAIGNWQLAIVPESTITLSQWEAYELNKTNIPIKDALLALVNWMDKHKMERLIAKTQILIAPGYEFKIVKGLITNFHQPNSTLLLLVAALIGKEWKQVYDYALLHDFRFLSYGDGSLLWREI